jgi:hypothetical protein
MSDLLGFWQEQEEVSNHYDAQLVYQNLEILVNYLNFWKTDKQIKFHKRSWTKEGIKPDFTAYLYLEQCSSAWFSSFVCSPIK